MVWKPFLLLLCHTPHVSRYLVTYSPIQVLVVVGLINDLSMSSVDFTLAFPKVYSQWFHNIWAWGRFMFWTCIFSIFPHWATFTIFWITAPLYKGYWTCICQKPVPSCNHNSFVMHRDTMVLTNVIHPTQGSFRMAH